MERDRRSIPLPLIIDLYWKVCNLSGMFILRNRLLFQYYLAQILSLIALNIQGFKRLGIESDPFIYGYFVLVYWVRNHWHHICGRSLPREYHLMSLDQSFDYLKKKKPWILIFDTSYTGLSDSYFYNVWSVIILRVGKRVNCTKFFWSKRKGCYYYSFNMSTYVENVVTRRSRLGILIFIGLAIIILKSKHKKKRWV